MDRLETLSRALESQTAWRAEFNQEYTSVGMSKPDEALGRIWLAWPDRALFHTGEPPQQQTGFHGRTVRLVDLGDRACDEHQLSDREWELVPLAAVLDPRGATAHFEIAAHGGAGIVLVPREPGGVEKVELILGENDLPAQVVVYDPQGAVNRLVFSGWVASSGPPKGEWLPAPPDNVECSTDPGALD